MLAEKIRASVFEHNFNKVERVSISLGAAQLQTGER